MSRGFASAGPNVSYGSTSDTRIPDVSYSGTPFSPTEMFDLSEKIVSNMYVINSSWKQLDQALKNIGTSKDNQELRDKVSSTQTSANQIISQTTKDLQRLTNIVRNGDKQQKLQVEKLTNSFKEAVQKYSRVQKQVAEKIKLSLLQIDAANSESTLISNQSEEEQQLMGKQKLATKDLEFEQGLLIEREVRIKEIEDNILDINQIMRELGALVHEQNEDINTIENSIETAHATVEAGTQQLEKAASYQDKRRKKVCVLLGISVAVGIVLAIIIAIVLR